MTDFICVPACSGVHYLDSLSQFALAKERVLLQARLLLPWIDCAKPLPVRADLEPRPPLPLSVPTRSNVELTS